MLLDSPSDSVEKVRHPLGCRYKPRHCRDAQRYFVEKHGQPHWVARRFKPFFVTAQAEKRSVIKGEMTVGGKWANIRRANLHVNERLTSA